MTHIYNWLDDNKENKDVEKLWKYFDFRTRDVVWQWNNKNLEPNYLCLCEYKGRTYKFNGISKFGDVWLHSNFNAEHGYVKRVDIDECTNFTYIDKPKIDIKKKHWLKDKNNDNKSRSIFCLYNRYSAICYCLGFARTNHQILTYQLK